MGKKGKAKLAAFKVLRDGDGNLAPVEKETQFGLISVLPMTYGDAEIWGEEMKDAKNISADALAKQFAKHIVDPSMKDVTGDDLKNDFKPLAIQELLMAVIGASGLSDHMTSTVNEDGTARVEIKNS